MKTSAATAAHPRLPLVFASRAASRQAARLGLGVIENAVGEAILAGRVSHDPHREGDTARVEIGAGVIALAARTRSPLSGRRAWKVIAVRRDDGGRR